MVRDELFTSQSELRGSREELRAARDELRNKTTLLDGARHEASEAINSVERLTEECHGFRGDLHRQETLVVQRDEVTARLRDEAYTQWASGWLAFQRKAANAYPGLDFNFDIPSDEEAEESFSTDYSGEPDTPAEAHSPSSPSALTSNILSPAHIFACLLLLLFFFFFVYLGTQDICSLFLNEYSFCISPLSPLLVLFALFCMNRIDFVAAWPELSV